MHAQRSAGSFYGTLVAAAFLTFVFHEAAHWSAGTLLGYDMTVGLNHAVPRAGEYRSTRDAFLVDAAGPAFTVLQAILAFALIRCRDFAPAYPVLFVACMMRFAAMVVGVAHPNDEARMSAALGWNPWMLPGLVVTGLLALTWLGSRRLAIGWRRNVTSYLICSAVFALVVWLDAYLRPSA
jgi:hypothetical protein